MTILSKWIDSIHCLPKIWDILIKGTLTTKSFNIITLPINDFPKNQTTNCYANIKIGTDITRLINVYKYKAFFVWLIAFSLFIDNWAIKNGYIAWPIGPNNEIKALKILSALFSSPIESIESLVLSQKSAINEHSGGAILNEKVCQPCTKDPIIFLNETNVNLFIFRTQNKLMVQVKNEDIHWNSKTIVKSDGDRTIIKTGIILNTRINIFNNAKG